MGLLDWLIDPITDMLTGGASSAAQKSAKNQDAAMKQQKEWLAKIWKYYEPELQRKQQMQTAMDPYRQQAGSWLASMMGLKSVPQFGVTPPPAPMPMPSPAQAPAATQQIAPTGIQTWNQPMAARPKVPVTGPAAGIGGSADTLFSNNQRYLGNVWNQNRPVPVVPPNPTPPTTPTPAPGPLTPTIMPPVPMPAAPVPSTTPTAPPWFLQVPELSTGLNTALTGTPDWQNPFTPEQKGAMTNLSDVTIGDQYAQRNTGMQQMLARRGLAPVGGTSSMDTSAQVGLQNWLQQQQAAQRSQMALAGMQRGDQLRSENLGNLVNQNQLEAGRRSEGRVDYNTLLNFLAGQTAAQPDASVLYPGATGYGNMAGQYGNMAGQYGNMAGQSMQGWGQLLAALTGGG